MLSLRVRVRPGAAALAPFVLAITLASCASGAPSVTALATASPTATLLPSPTTSARGLTVDSVLNALSAYAPNCEGSGGDWSCWGHPGGNVYLGLITAGPSPSELIKVRATYSVPAAVADDEAAIAFFQELARLPYTGAEPSRAADWVQQSWAGATNADPAETDIGPGHFVLTVVESDRGADYSLDLLATDGYLD